MLFFFIEKMIRFVLNLYLVSEIDFYLIGIRRLDQQSIFCEAFINDFCEKSNFNAFNYDWFWIDLKR